MAKNNDDIATIAYMKGFEDGRDAEAKEAAVRIEHWMTLEAKAKVELDSAMARIGDLESAFWWIWEVNPKIQDGIAHVSCTKEQWKIMRSTLGAPTKKKD